MKFELGEGFMEFLNKAMAKGDDNTTCPHCGPDTSGCAVHSARDSQAGLGIGAESYDVSQASQSSYDAEAFTTSSAGGIE
jgi:hypothetical protein